MKIVSLQSAVAFGHVGNSAALLPLQLLGHEVWPIDTVQFSNHPGHGGFRGQRLAPDHLAAMIEGLAAVGALDQCDGLLSGYLGAAAVAEVAASAIGRIRASRPGALYLCDPVMGDAPGGLYVDPALPEAFRARLLPLADLITPNRFELEWLAGQPVGDLGAAAAAARGLLGQDGSRPRMVVATGLPVGTDHLSALAVSAEGAWQVVSPRLPFDPDPSGTGDLLAALLFGHLLGGRTLPAALEEAVAGLHAVLERTRAEGRRELALVAAQDAMIAPPRHFAAQRLPG